MIITEKMRAHVVWLYESGMSRKDIRQELGISHVSVRKILKEAGYSSNLRKIETGRVDFTLPMAWKHLLSIEAERCNIHISTLIRIAIRHELEQRGYGAVIRPAPWGGNKIEDH